MCILGRGEAFGLFNFVQLIKLSYAQSCLFLSKVSWFIIRVYCLCCGLLAVGILSLFVFILVKLSIERGDNDTEFALIKPDKLFCLLLLFNYLTIILLKFYIPTLELKFLQLQLKLQLQLL